MKKFWKSKKFWGVLILIGIGIFVYYYFFSPTGTIALNKKQIEEEYKKDTKAPHSQILPPFNTGWNKKDFTINVLDEDVGSGIKENSCQYGVFSYNQKGEETFSGWMRRKCNSTQIISVGPEGNCQAEGIENCLVYVRCQDKAGNWYSPSKKESGIRSYNIDWTAPDVSKLIIERENLKAKVTATDTFKITACLLYIDKENQGPMNFLDPNCYNNCSLEKEFTLPGAGFHNVFAYCVDSAGNWKKSEPTQFALNTPPIINYCKCSPASANKNSEIQFTIEAKDIDNNKLSFLWNFGDGTSSQEKNPIHSYSKSGTYTPEVIVSDGVGGKTNCSTAWISIKE